MSTERKQYVVNIQKEILRYYPNPEEDINALGSLTDENIKNLTEDDLKNKYKIGGDDNFRQNLFLAIRKIRDDNETIKKNDIESVTNEYKKMDQYLNGKTQIDLEFECIPPNDECEGDGDLLDIATDDEPNEDWDISKIPCPPLQRLLVLLRAFHQYLQSAALWDKVTAHSIFAIEDDGGNTIYGHKQIHDDMAHFIQCHATKKPHGSTKIVKEFLCERLRTSPLRCRPNRVRRRLPHGQDPLSSSMTSPFAIASVKSALPDGDSKENAMQCLAYLRHHRDRESLKEQAMYYKDLQYVESHKKRNQIIDDKDVIFQQELDKIHCYFLQFGPCAFEMDIDDEIFGNRRKQQERHEIEAEGNRTAYIGETEDQKWLKHIMDKSKCDHEEKEKEIDPDEAMYRQLVENMGVFYWQRPHGFRETQHRGLRHIKQRYANIKEEVLHNRVAALTVDQWNQTLRKSKVFDGSSAKKKIRASGDSYFQDQIMDHEGHWNNGEVLTLRNILSLKLYTDFDSLQKALKGSLRFNCIFDILHANACCSDDHREMMMEDCDTKKKWHRRVENLEFLLSEFYHWKGALMIIVKKFSAKITDKTLYHGVDTKMIIVSNRTLSFFGPLSTTASEHIAKTFATAKGMVLTMKSNFPRLNHCYGFSSAFDAKLISDYPEEQEHLVGHCYVRLLNIYTRPLFVRTDTGKNMKTMLTHAPLSLEELQTKVPLASWLREEFLAIHLLREQIFAMNEHLAQILAQYLRVCREASGIEKSKSLEATDYPNDLILLTLNWRGDELSTYVESHDNFGVKSDAVDAYYKNKDANQREAIEYWQKVTPLFWKKFDYFRCNLNKRQRLRFDEISPILKRYFMEQTEERDIKTKKRKWTISFREITTIFPNVKELHFVNQYKFDDVVLKALIEQIQTDENTVEKVLFQYFAYNRRVRGIPSAQTDYALNDICFFDPRDLNGDLMKRLEGELGWKMKHNEIGQGGGYKISVWKHHSNMGDDDDDDDNDESSSD